MVVRDGEGESLHHVMRDVRTVDRRQAHAGGSCIEAAYAVAVDHFNPLAIVYDTNQKTPERGMARKTAMRVKRVARRDWSAHDERELRKHSKNKTPVKDISKALKRTPGALRQKARNLGISIGHQRRSKKKRT